jgi:hypothetical protein
MFQCQLCKKTFDTKTKLENHAVKVHGKSQYTFTASDNYNNTESMLLERTAKEKKARKRTRGPYRKSVSSSSSYSC